MNHSEASEDKKSLEQWWDCQLKLQKLHSNNHRYPAAVIRYGDFAC